MGIFDECWSGQQFSVEGQREKKAHPEGPGRELFLFGP